MNAITLEEKREHCQHHYHTFRTLLNASHIELEKIFQKGLTPKLSDLEGWEFKGANTLLVAPLLRIKKFKKGFYRDKTTSKHELYGYNVSVRQNNIDYPYLALPNELHPKHFGFFLVTPSRPYGPDNLHPHALMLDYSRGPQNPQWDPSNTLRDYIVQVDPTNFDLFLGKAYLALPKIPFKRLFVSFFVLERYNIIGL